MISFCITNCFDSKYFIHASIVTSRGPGHCSSNFKISSSTRKNALKTVGFGGSCDIGSGGGSISGALTFYFQDLIWMFFSEFKKQKQKYNFQLSNYLGQKISQNNVPVPNWLVSFGSSESYDSRQNRNSPKSGQMCDRCNNLRTIEVKLLSYSQQIQTNFRSPLVYTFGIHLSRLSLRLSFSVAMRVVVHFNKSKKIQQHSEITLFLFYCNDFFQNFL